MYIHERSAGAFLSQSVRDDDEWIVTDSRIPKREKAIGHPSVTQTEFPDVLVDFLEYLRIRRVLGLPHDDVHLLSRLRVHCRKE